MKEANRCAASQHIVKKEERGSVEHKVVNRNMRPRIGKPTPNFTVRESAWKQSHGSRFEQSRHIEDRKQQEEHRAFDRIVQPHNMKKRRCSFRSRAAMIDQLFRTPCDSAPP